EWRRLRVRAWKARSQSEPPAGGLPPDGRDSHADVDVVPSSGVVEVDDAGNGQRDAFPSLAAVVARRGLRSHDAEDREHARELPDRRVEDDGHPNGTTAEVVVARVDSERRD